MFTNVFLIISNSIGSDWIKLYYSLPFYPLRGKETIKKDIDDVVSNLNRGNMQRVNFFNCFNNNYNNNQINLLKKKKTRNNVLYRYKNGVDLIRALKSRTCAWRSNRSDAQTL